MITDINSEDRLVQQTFAEYLHDARGWESVYAWNHETFGPHGMLGRDSEREVVLKRDLRAALVRLNPDLPESAREQALVKLTRASGSILASGNGALRHTEAMSMPRCCAMACWPAIVSSTS